MIGIDENTQSITEAVSVMGNALIGEIMVGGMDYARCIYETNAKLAIKQKSG